MSKFEARDEDIQAGDYRAYFDSSCFRVWHLNGKDRTFKIARVTRLTSEMASGGKREIKKQPKLELTDSAGKSVPLPLLLNKTNAKTIAQLYGNNPKAWEGNLITLFPSTTSVGGAEVDCIRVRPKVPSAKRKGPEHSATEAPLNHDRDAREPGADEEEPPYGALESDNVQH